MGRAYTVLGIVCLLGVASLLPWNVLITQAQYLTIRAHRDGSTSGSWWADQIESLTANFYLFFNLAAFLVLLPLGKHISLHKQISLPLSVSAVVVLLQAYIAYDVRLPGPYFVGNTLVSTALLGAATAPMTSATYALASFLPPLYIQARNCLPSEQPLIETKGKIRGLYSPSPSSLLPQECFLSPFKEHSNDLAMSVKQS